MGGLGYEVVLVLVKVGVCVVIVGWNLEKGCEVVFVIMVVVLQVEVLFEGVDFVSLVLIECFVGCMIVCGEGIDLLINNVGIMFLLQCWIIEDGLEM